MMRILSALLVPIVIAALLAWLAPRNMDTRLQLQRLEVASAADLEVAFAAMGYSWPPEEVPAIELQTFPADLADVSDARQRKALFFRALLPIVLAENRVIGKLRQQLIALFDKGVERLNRSELSWLKRVAEQYQVEGGLASRQLQQELLGRVDVVPPDLVLIQAANESGWGTSRFALSGNNLFGQYTYQQSDGIVPLNRRAGETHALRAFSSIDDSVRSYIHNLNTHQAYSELRNLRQQLRSRGKEPSGDDLAAGLGAYSERGAAYVEEIQAMIRSNQLPALLKDVSLDREGS
jgi:Bax protein